MTEYTYGTKSEFLTRIYLVTYSPYMRLINFSFEILSYTTYVDADFIKLKADVLCR